MNLRDRITEILYKNSHDDSKCMRIKFENVQNVISLLEIASKGVDTNVLQKAIQKFGTQTQINKIQEEALELSLVLNQMNCPTKDPQKTEEALYDELADMKIMMAQAELLFDSFRINERVKFKLDRLNKTHLQ